jgi:hypothetical protein
VILKPPRSRAGALLLGRPFPENLRHQTIQLQLPIKNGDDHVRV